MLPQYLTIPDIYLRDTLSLPNLFVSFRMPCRCISGLMVMRNRTCVNSATEASGRKALWCDISAITPGKSLSNAQSAAGALPSMGHSIGICVLKVGDLQRSEQYVDLVLSVPPAPYTQCAFYSRQAAATRTIQVSSRVR